MDRQFERLLSDKTQAPVLTVQQYKDLIAITSADSRNGVRNVAVIWLLFTAGLRITELARLRVKDVLMADGTLMEQPSIPGSFTKTGKPRSMFIVEPKCRAAIEDYLAQRLAKNKGVSLDLSYRGLHPTSNLFLSSGNKGFALSYKEYKANDEVRHTWVATSMQHLITKLLKRVGVTKGSSHCGRRTMATRLYHKTGDIEMVQHILGHATPEQTTVYVDAHRDAIKKAQKAIWPGLEDKL